MEAEATARTSGMRERIISAGIAIPVVLASVNLSTHLPLAILALIAGVLAMLELRRMTEAGFVPIPLLTAVAALLLEDRSLTPTMTRNGLWMVGAFLVFGIAVLTLWLRGRRVPDTLHNFGRMWVDAPLAALLFLHGNGRSWTELHPSLVLLCLVPLWLGDTAGLVVGKWLGRRPLAPAISPKKTWEGAIGNAVACLIGAWLIGTWLEVETWRWLGVGLVCGVLGQAGDLFESALKRKSDLKDSGNVLPGHGGLLDRLDSTLITAIPNALILML